MLYVWACNTLKRTETTLLVNTPENFKLDLNKNYIFISNHSSLFDIPVIYASLCGRFKKSLRMLGKKELSYIPIWGHAMHRGEVPFIDRKNRTQAIKDLAYAKQLMQSGISIWIAPEGSRSKHLQPFKKGAFVMAIETGATIIPIGIQGTYDLLAAKSIQLKLGQTISVKIGVPIEASDYAIADKLNLLKRSEQSVKNLLSELNLDLHQGT